MSSTQSTTSTMPSLSSSMMDDSSSDNKGQSDKDDDVKKTTTLTDMLLHKNENLVAIPDEREGAWIDFRVLRAYMGPAVCTKVIATH
jgi:hypothetical protein